MGYLAGALGVVCLFLSLRLYSLDRNLKRGAEQLKRRREEKGATPLSLAAPHRASEELLSQVNGLLQDGERERADFRRREQALRRQIANVSHDLRTPLTSILGYLQLLDSPEVTGEQRRAVWRRGSTPSSGSGWTCVRSSAPCWPPFTMSWRAILP